MDILEKLYTQAKKEYHPEVLFMHIMWYVHWKAQTAPSTQAFVLKHVAV